MIPEFRNLLSWNKIAFFGKAASEFRASAFWENLRPAAAKPFPLGSESVWASVSTSVLATKFSIHDIDNFTREFRRALHTATVSINKKDFVIILQGSWVYNKEKRHGTIWL